MIFPTKCMSSTCCGCEVKNTYAAFAEDSQSECQGEELPDLRGSDGGRTRFPELGVQAPPDKKNEWKTAERKHWRKANALDAIHEEVGINLVGEEPGQANLNIGFQVADVKKPLM